MCGQQVGCSSHGSCHKQYLSCCTPVDKASLEIDAPIRIIVNITRNTISLEPSALLLGLASSSFGETVAVLGGGRRARVRHWPLSRRFRWGFRRRRRRTCRWRIGCFHRSVGWALRGGHRRRTSRSGRGRFRWIQGHWGGGRVRSWNRCRTGRRLSGWRTCRIACGLRKARESE